MHAVRTISWRLWVTLLLALLQAACGRYWVCGDLDPGVAQLPARLSETGLYANIATGELAPGVTPYTPRFALWSDGSEKQRWIWLPPGTQIDTSDMDDWVFPEGTKLWKQFSLGGTRLETRLLQKRGPGDAGWNSLAYVWNVDGSEAVAAPLGEIDTHATDHDVPAAGECVACHGGRRSYVLGFSAIQLTGPAGDDAHGLAAVVARGWLSAPPAQVLGLPGNATEVAALGYLHANCGHCHNQRRPARSGARCFNPKDDQDFTLGVAELASVEATATYRTVVGHAVKRGAPDDSKLYHLVTSRGFFRQMPPLATEKVDADAVATLRAWIEGL